MEVKGSLVHSELLLQRANIQYTGNKFESALEGNVQVSRWLAPSVHQMHHIETSCCEAESYIQAWRAA